MPTAVRVDAGWDGRPAVAAVLNRLRVDDVALDRPHADIAAAVRTAPGIPVADAHLAATPAGTGGRADQ